jgi:lipoate-protein ligase A
MALEDTMLAAAADGNRRFGWAMWETDQCLVAPASMRCRIDGTVGASKSAQAGWPVHYRRSGGGVTPQGPGVINVSIAYALRPGKKPSIEGSYRSICAPIVNALAVFGLAASMGPVTGSFCDGSHNVIVAGRKLAGTAQRWKSGVNGGIAVLAHALILIETPSDRTMAAINALHRDSGIEDELRREALLSTADLGLQAGNFINTLLRHLRTRADSLDPAVISAMNASR